MQVQELFEKICRDLPDDWNIEIRADNTGVSIELDDPNGEAVDFGYEPTETPIEEEIIQAIRYAVDHDQDYND